MKTLFFFIAIFAFSFNSFAQDVILIEGKDTRVDALAHSMEGHANTKKIKMEIKKSYIKVGFNNPEKDDPGTVGTWCKITHLSTGATRFVQTSSTKLAEVQAKINSTSDDKEGEIINTYCKVQADAQRYILSLVSPKVADNDCRCKTEVIVKLVEVPVPAPAKVEVEEFVPAVDPCQTATLEFAKLETLYNYADKATLQRNGFKNRKAVEGAMVDLAIQNPICLSGKLHKDENNNWIYWAAAGAGVVLLVDIIEGNGIDLFGINFGNNQNSKMVLPHTEPVGGLPHTGTGGTIPTNRNLPFGKTGN